MEALSWETVHIWFVWLTVPPWSAQTLWSLLSTSERRRAGQYVFVSDQQAFVLRRGLLRILLAQYVGKPPAHLQLVTGPQGKPELLPELAQPTLSFNLSHSGDLVLYAVAWNPVGIDVEQVTTELDIAALSACFFTPTERAWLTSLPLDRQRSAALRLWTCKEAAVKATGVGITGSLREVAIAFDNGDACLLSRPGDTQPARQWMLQEFSPAPGYVATVAHRKTGPAMSPAIRPLVSMLASSVEMRPAGRGERSSAAPDY